MIEGYAPITQALLGTLFTWGMTAAGAALVIIFHGTQRKLLDGSLGFAAGVMTAASYWSLLAPAIEMAEESGLYGEKGEYAFAPVAVGFLLGALFVFGTDVALATCGMAGLAPAVLLQASELNKGKDGVAKKEQEAECKAGPIAGLPSSLDTGADTPLCDIDATPLGFCADGTEDGSVARRRVATRDSLPSPSEVSTITQIDTDPAAMSQAALTASGNKRWKRILLLIVAITVHNIPEGLAVGVGFGAIGQSPSATFESARNLAFGIGLQNFPEGLAVSLPLHASGFSIARSFWYGQLSGMVEPVAGLLGAAAVQVATPILPYALSFAAGAMIYVVIDDIVPEANSGENGRLATWGAILGFVLMMAMDVGLG